MKNGNFWQQDRVAQNTTKALLEFLRFDAMRDQSSR